MRAVMKLVSAMAKVFLDGEPRRLSDDERLEGFENEVISFQAAWILAEGEGHRAFVSLEAESPVAAHVRVRRVVHVPVCRAAYPDADDDYLRKSPGLYPDLLRDVASARLHAEKDRWQSAWIDVEGAAPGRWPVRLRLRGPSGELLAEAEACVHVLPGKLPAQALRNARWFHGDCLARYYSAPVRSEAWWALCGDFLAHAAKRGVNVALVPIHTPPLDTRVGIERLTCQLVDIEAEEGGRYRFDFAALGRYIALCRAAGMEYFEMAHLFTQWGAACAPKIVARVNGVEKRIFGWDAPALGGEYQSFLAQYLPALCGALKNLGVADRTYFHISDEPEERVQAAYLAAKRSVQPYLEGFPILDALSHPGLYRADPSVIPIPATDQIAPFLNERPAERWTYYCCGQHRQVGNLFIAMPSYRNRILGVQLYVHQMDGFLQWGWNFYNSERSDYPIDPFATADGDGFVPAGDPFQVYPGAGGRPEDSIRSMMILKSMEDLRALRWLEQKRGREYVLSLIERLSGGGIAAFDRYPRDDLFLPRLRGLVNRALTEG